MGARSGSAALPTGEGIADGVFAEGEASCSTQTLHIGPGTQIGFAEDDACDDGRLGFRDAREGSEFLNERLNVEIGVCRHGLC